VLRHVPQVHDPRVVVAAATADDAAVLRLSATRALVATVDFFTPIVDDPYAFGAIAAANALSDVYAMGGTPLMALNLVAWPRRPELLELLGEVLRGAGDVAREAGALVLGGHSIDDDEPKFGMVALGEVRPDQVITNAGARPGDRLVLTKPLGTGILSTALKRELLAEPDLAEAVRVMVTLNAGAAHAMIELGDAIHAATDVTGFGLLGHLRNVLLASHVGARIVAERVPLFAGVTDLIVQGAVPGGTVRNREAAARFTTYAAALTEVDRTWLSDAQTSGGLLIAVAADRADALVAALARRATPAAALIGTVTEGRQGAVEVVASDA
jgi:selenide,water dikinase